MGRMTIRISDDLEKKVRAKAKERFGEGEDNLSKAFEAAFNEYIEAVLKKKIIPAPGLPAVNETFK